MPHEVVKDMELERNRDPITLTRFLLSERKLRAPSSTGDFTMLLQSIQLAVKVIASATHKAGLANMYGLAGGRNESGDDQKKLDVLANDVFINTCRFSGQVYLMGSEEDDDAIVVEGSQGGYAVVFDPLDGSSNIDCNCGVGSIWGIYQKDFHDSTPLFSSSSEAAKGLLRPGNELVAAGYALYGPATMIVLSTGHGVHGFTLDPSIGEFLLTHRRMRVPTTGSIYSLNEGNRRLWDGPTKKFVQTMQQRSLRGRYIGSMVLDVHRTLLYGGIFAYPGDSKNPQGKLRLLYECNPIAFLIEQAGGRAITGGMVPSGSGADQSSIHQTHGRILNIQPQSLHQRCPIWLGSESLINEIEKLYFESFQQDSQPQSQSSFVNSML